MIKSNKLNFPHPDVLMYGAVKYRRVHLKPFYPSQPVEYVHAIFCSGEQRYVFWWMDLTKDRASICDLQATYADNH